MRTFSVALVTVCLVLGAGPTVASAQTIKTMEYSAGPEAHELAVKVEYEDPSDVHVALEGTPVVAIRFEMKNVSRTVVPFEIDRLKLGLGSAAPVGALAPNDAVEAIRRAQKMPALLRFLGASSTAFHPRKLETWVQRNRLRDGALSPGQMRKGYVFFQPHGGGDNGIVWIDTAGWKPQLLETKGVKVQTRQPQSAGLLDRLKKMLVGPEPAFERSYALLVGVGKYRHLPSLEGPARDVEKVSDYLYSQGFDEIATITDEDVRLETFAQPQRYFRSKLGPRDRFLFYYSGHGMSVVEGDRTRGYLPLVDEVPKGRTRSIPMDGLVGWMESLVARQLLVILDSCFSGLAIPQTEERKGLTDPSVESDIHRLARGPARYLLMAGTAGQQAFGGHKWNGSLFTEMLLRGVRSEADLYRNRVVTARGLYVWLKDRVQREALENGRELTPLFMDLNRASEGDFVFVTGG